MSDHIHQYFLAKFTDNSEDIPSTLYGKAVSDYEWRGVSLFVCHCGLAKEVRHNASFLLRAKEESEQL